MAALKAPPTVSLSLSLVPRSIEDLERLSVIVFKAGPPPGHGCHQSVAMAIAFGLEIGLLPIQAVASVSVVNGKPSLYGDAALGLLQASPFCSELEHGLDGEGDDRVGWMRTQRKGEDKARETRFSVADAVTAQLWSKKGPWQTYPNRMLVWKAVSFHMKDWWADVLRGLSIHEDLAAEMEARSEARQREQPAIETDKPAVVRVESEAARPTAAPELPAAPTVATPIVTVAGVPVTNTQLAKLAGELKPAFIALQNVDKEDREAVAVRWERVLSKWNVKSALDLTEAQANELIAVLTEARDTVDPTIRGLFLPAGGSAA